MARLNPKISIYWFVLVAFGGLAMLPLVMSDKYGQISPGKVYLRALHNDPFFDDATRILVHCSICVAVAVIVTLLGYREEPPATYSIAALMVSVGVLAAILAFLRSHGASWELYACVGLCVFGRFIASIPRWFVGVIPTESPLNRGGQDHLK